MFKSIFDRIWRLIELWLEFTFRRRMPGMIAITTGAALLLALLGGLALDLSTPWGAVSFTTEVATPNWLVLGVFSVAAALIVVGILWTSREFKALDRKRVFVIELRGLRDMSGCPLVNAVPLRIPGRREQVLVNLRQGQDGKITDPVVALKKIDNLPNDLSTRETGLDRQDFTYVLGGLASVPLTVLTGIVTDDECAVTLMDWDRHRGRWREIDGIDDGKRFAIIGVDGLGENVSDVALAVSVSYGVNMQGVASKFPDMPIVELTLDGAGTEAHWSEEKQIALGQQFLDTMMRLDRLGVKTVHMFLAAPSSVALRFGRLYDKRNLPGLIVYQFEPSDPPFPWGVKMPVQEEGSASLV